MKLQEVLQSKKVRLPIKRPNSDGFFAFTKKLLHEYYRIIDSCDFPEGINKKECLKQLDIVIAGINGSLSAYYRGSPFDAYRLLRNALKTIAENAWAGIEFESKFNFYRLRVKESNYSLSRGELFHIPFHMRGKIETQRYSIPGFPSLYISNSVYLAWEELRRPKFENIQGARLTNKIPLPCLNLTTTRYQGDYSYNGENEKLFNDVIIWPLIACCCIKVKNDEDSFKPEFIVPQLLLQWIRNNQRQWKGIAFSSTHIDFSEMKVEGEFYNVVIPVQENSEVNYCTKTSCLFNMTDVLAWQLKYFSTGAAGVTTQYTAFNSVNSYVKRIELIKNKSFPYDFSPLADFEMTLNTMKLLDIDF